MSRSSRTNNTAKSVRQYLHKELSKIYSCAIDSNHTDYSYMNFSNAIRINHNESIIHIIITHVDITRIKIYAQLGNRSIKQISYDVDLLAPNFGTLSKDIMSYIKKTIITIDDYNYRRKHDAY